MTQPESRRSQSWRSAIARACWVTFSPSLPMTPTANSRSPRSLTKLARRSGNLGQFVENVGLDLLLGAVPLGLLWLSLTTIVARRVSSEPGRRRTAGHIGLLDFWYLAHQAMPPRHVTRRVSSMGAPGGSSRLTATRASSCGGTKPDGRKPMAQIATAKMSHAAAQRQPAIAQSDSQKPRIGAESSRSPAPP